MGGGEKYTSRHKAAGKLLPRERIELLLDRDAYFLELCPLAGKDVPGHTTGAAFIGGIGKVSGVEVVISANDSTVKGGAISEMTAAKSGRLNDIAEQNRLPTISLIEKQSKNAGRNNNGRITVRHQGGGHKQHYRIVDFRRNKDGIPAKVERIEYDPNRSAHLALLCYSDGERRYIIAPRGLEVGAQVVSGSEAPIKTGNALPIRNIPVGSTIHCIEMMPGKGAQLARAAGTSIRPHGRGALPAASGIWPTSGSGRSCSSA